MCLKIIESNVNENFIETQYTYKIIEKQKLTDTH